MTTDRVVFGNVSTNSPQLAHWLKRFALLHSVSEESYNGDGSWGKGYSQWDRTIITATCSHPLVRETSRRMFGYIQAYRLTKDETYLCHIKEGMSHLIREQNPDGSFPWWINDTGTTVGTPDFHIYSGVTNLQYETAIAGCALIKGYELLGDESYSDASRIACYWSASAPYSCNNNYEAFTVWHQTTHYKITNERPGFLAGLKRVPDVLIDQKPNGGWPGHNSFIWYHGIIIRGLSSLLAVMPADYPGRDKIALANIAAVNHMLTLIEPDGCMRYSDEYEGYSDFISLPICALIAANEVIDDDLGPAINLLLERFDKAIERSPYICESKRPNRKVPAGKEDVFEKKDRTLDARMMTMGSIFSYLSE